MKPQQRKFIVEVKSARRRSTIRPSSIWGDTDLKALAREAEIGAPHLFEPVAPPSERSPEQSVEVRTHEAATTDDVAPIADPAVVPEAVSGLPGTYADSISPREEKRPKTARPKVSKRGPTRGIRRTGSATIKAAAKEPLPDLTALEEENLRLKVLLVQRLQQENNQLRRMLERFASN